MKSTIIILLMSMAIVFSNGCNTQPGLTIDSKDSISVEYCPKALIIAPQLQLADDTAWLSGSIAQRSDSAGPLVAHIDIKAYSADGKELFTDRTDSFTIPKKTIGRFSDKIPFRIQLSHIPTPDDKIILTIHDSCKMKGCPMRE